MLNNTYSFYTKKNINRLLLAISNISRLLMVSVVGLFINYVLLHYKHNSVLNSYVYLVSIVNITLVFSNWGGKEFIISQLTKHSNETKLFLNNLFNSRLIILFFCSLITLVSPIEFYIKLFAILYLIPKTLLCIIDPLVTVSKSFNFFLVLDLILNTLFFIFIFFDQNFSNHIIFFIELLIIEWLKMIIGLYYFKANISFVFSLNRGIEIIKTALPFFYLSLAGFLCSKADLYVVGFVVNKQQMSYYFIVLNIVSLSHIVYSTYLNTFSNSMYRFSEKLFKQLAVPHLIIGSFFSIVFTILIFLLLNYYYQIAVLPIFYFFIFLNLFSFTLVVRQMYKFIRTDKLFSTIKVYIACGLFNIILSYFLSQQYGFLGSFISNTLTLFIIFIWLYYLFKDITIQPINNKLKVS